MLSQPGSGSKAATTLAEEGAARVPPDGLAFDWMQTVWAYGIFRLHQNTGDAQWRDYNQEWMALSVDSFTGTDPWSFHSSDSMSPVSTKRCAPWVMRSTKLCSLSRRL